MCMGAIRRRALASKACPGPEQRFIDTLIGETGHRVPLASFAEFAFPACSRCVYWAQKGPLQRAPNTGGRSSLSTAC